MPTIVLQSSQRGRESCLFYFICVLAVCGCQCYVSLPHGAVGWSVVGAFPGHTHLLFLADNTGKTISK